MQLEDALRRYPKENLARTPTPLQFLPHLSEQLRVRVYIKRDDLTDLAMGGDKARGWSTKSHRHEPVERMYWSRAEARRAITPVSRRPPLVRWGWSAPSSSVTICGA